MAISPQQVLEFRQKALSMGKSEDEINQFLASKGVSESGTTRLRGQFAGTAAIPTESVSRVDDIGAWEGLESLIPSTLYETVAGPIVGVGERLGMVEEGTRQNIREGFEEARLDYLSADPTAGRAAVAGVAEAMGNVIPLVPGGALGKGAARLATKAGAGSMLAKFAAGAVPGLAEGAVVGIGDTVGMEPGDALRTGALMTLAGGAMGSLGGVKQHLSDKAAPKVDANTERYLGRYIGDSKAKGETVRGLYDKVRAHWIDKHGPVSYAPEKLLREGKKKGMPASERLALLSERDEALLLANQAKTGDHTALAPIESHTKHPITQENTGEGLLQVLTDGLSEDALPDLKAAGMAHRQLELRDRAEVGAAALDVARDALKAARARGAKADEIKVIKQEMSRAKEEAGIKVSDEDVRLAEDMLQSLEGRYGGELDARLQRFTDWSKRAIIDPLREVGIFSQAEVDDMMASNRWYVPFIRAAGAIEGKQLDIGLGGAPVKGKRIHRGLSELEKDLIKDPFGSAAERAVQVHSFARKQALRNFMGDFSIRYADDIGEEVGPVSAQHIGDTFRHWRDGQMTNFKGPKELIQALETLNFKQANLLAKTARGMTQTFRAGATLTPEFSFRNLFKDAFTFSINSKYHNAGPASIAKTLFEELAYMAGHRGDTSPRWKEFMDSAAAHTTWLSADRSGAGLARTIGIARKAAQQGKARSALDRGAKNPLAPFQALSQFIERLPRYTEFKGARKAGKNIRQAEFEAGDVTLPFHRAGQIGGTVNLYEAFFNAQVQDMSKFARAVKERPFTTTFRGMAALTVPTLATMYMHKDDPEYRSLPEWEKVLFIHPFKMSNGKYFRVPIPPGILGLAFSYFPRKMAEHFFGDNPQALEQLMEETVQQTPLQYAPVPGLNSMTDALTRLAPNALQPLVEVGMNRNPFFDRPVMSERLMGRDPLEQKTKYTTNLAKGIAGAVGSVPFLSQTRAASPQTVDYLLSGYGAGIGRTIAQATGSDMPARRIGRDGIFSMMGFRGLQSTSPVGFSSQPVQDVYDLSEKIDQSWSTYKIQSSEDHRVDYLSLHPEAAYSKQMRKVKEQFKAYSQYRESVQNNDNMPYVDKQDALLKIDQEITMFAASMMTEFYKAIERDKRVEAMNREAN